MTRAAFAAAGMNSAFRTGRFDDDAIALIDRALALAPDGPLAARARLHARKVALLLYARPQTEVTAESDSALELARRIDDDTTLTWALFGRFWATTSPDALDEHLATVDELVSVSARASSELWLEALCGWCYGQARANLPVAGIQRVAAARDAALASGVPGVRWLHALVAMMRVLLAGDLEEAETRLPALVADGMNVDELDGALFAGIALDHLRRMQGRPAELVDAIRYLAEIHTGLPVMRAMYARILALAGMHEEAADELRRQTADGCAMHRRDINWAPAIAALTEACVELGDRDAAVELERQWRSAPDQGVMTGPAVYEGPSIGFRAPLRALLGDRAGADADFDAALVILEREGATALADRLHRWRALTCAISAC